MEATDTADLLTAAAAGDQTAWDALVLRYARLVWAVVRGYRLNDADAADVSQATWLRLVERHAEIRNPAALGSWLATTARNEAISLLRARREVPQDEVEVPELGDTDLETPGRDLLVGERDREIWRAFHRLPHRCQVLLRVLVVDPVPNYAAAAAALGRPVGSLGPGRARCLAAMRRHLRSYIAGEGVAE
jgi:RNA polymerase sigma factor (sigma-70 family)